MPLKKKPQQKRVNRPMPTDPRELALAMFRQADQQMFSGVPVPKKKKKPASA